MITDYIICGWYTPDYRPWRDRLVENLDACGLPHDVVEVARPLGGWEKTTMLKARQVLSAMTRHPGKTIIFLDVDCLVVDADKVRALAAIKGDVGFYLRTKFRRGGDVRFGTRSGTMVFQPTPGARQFAELWARLSDIAPAYSVDQDSLAVAMGHAPDCLFSLLDRRYCAVQSDNLTDPWILHSSASNGRADKARKWKKRLARLLTPRPARVLPREVTA